MKLGIGPLPTYCPFMVGLRTVMAPVGELFNMLMYYNKCIMRYNVSVQFSRSVVQLFATP